jgi:CubicO group peptidase (beta-lactamase class C family)
MNKISYCLYLFLIILSATASHTFAQGKSFTSAAQINDSLVARFNRADFKGMYALESPELAKKDPQDGFINYFKGLFPETGKITLVKSLYERGSHHFFEWFGEKKNEQVEILASMPGMMDDYFLSDFVAQPGARTGPFKSDNPLKTRRDSAIQDAASVYLSDANSIGLSIGIYDKGKTYTYNYGEVKKGSGILPTPDNTYNIGSVAKTFVATMLAEAVVEGKVKLDDDIRKYLPGKYPNLEYQGHPIRFVNLSNHTSGLPTSPIVIPPKLMDSLMKLPDSVRFTTLVAHFKNFNADSLLKNMHGFKVDTIPGTKYAYNGNAMGVLILLLERIYRQPYEQLLTHYLHTHLDMHHTSSEFTAPGLGKFPQGYNAHGMPMPIIIASQFITAPSVNSTVHDMLKYIRANLAEKDPAIKLTHQITYDDGKGNVLGLNWMMGKDDDDGTPNTYHLGQTGTGFTTLCVFYPSKQKGYIIFVNDMISQGRLFDLLHRIQQEQGEK